jgi:hypothetical protein
LNSHHRPGRREIHTVASLSKARENTERHVGYIAIGTGTLNKRVEHRTVVAQRPAFGYQSAYQRATQVL